MMASTETKTLVESILNEGNAEWEISRWSDVDHGFTKWDDDRYNLRADFRSWSAFLTAMEDKMDGPIPFGATASPVAAPTSAGSIAFISVFCATLAFVASVHTFI